MWKNTRDLIDDFYDLHMRIRSGETAPKEANAEARVLQGAASVIHLELEHARMSRRVAKNADHLDGVSLTRDTKAIAKKRRG